MRAARAVRSRSLSLVVPFVSLAFAARSVAGVGFSYGSFAAALVAAASCLLYGALFAADAAGWGRAEAPLPAALAAVANGTPIVAYSLLALADALALGSAAAFPWPLLILVSAVLDPAYGGARSLYAAALPAACGVAAAAGAFGGPSRPQALLSLGLALIAAAFARTAARERHEAILRAASDPVERERARSSQRDAEVEIAARIQRTLLLDVPEISCAGLRIDAISVASSAVGGDFYAFMPYTPASVDVLVGDVMGKGIPSALLGAAIKGAFLRASLRLVAARPDSIPLPADIVTAVHAELVPKLMSLESYATLQYARIDVRRGLLDFVDCGHTPILHYDSTLGVCWLVKGTDLPLAFSAGADYARLSVPLAAGDRIVFHSDGITEAANEGGDLFGEARLADIVASNAAAEPQALTRRILNTTMYFAAGGAFRDDVTCVAVAVDEAPPLTTRAAAEFPAALSALPALRSFLEDALRGEEETFAARVILVADELASNAIRYGTPEGTAAVPAESLGGFDAADSEGDHAKAEDGEGDPGRGENRAAYPLPPRSLRLEYLAASGWVAIRIVHHGQDFPWYRAAAEPAMERLPSGGIGRYLIAAGADSVLYAAAGGGAAEDLRLACAVFLRRGL